MTATENRDEMDMDLLRGEKKVQDNSQTDRAVWGRKSEYLLSLIGYSVGLSSVWRFPFLCMKNGGGAFLIPFAFFMVLCGFPLYYLELCLGQFSGKSPLVVWNICPLFKGLGYAMVMLSLLVTWYYGTVTAWVIYYLGYSFFPSLPWSTCDNDWNTDNCVVFREKQMETVALNGTNSTLLLINNTVYFNGINSTQIDGEARNHTTAATEFWRYKVLNMSSGIEDWGVPQWPVVIVLVLSYASSFLCIFKGVKTVGKVVWVTALMPYVLLSVILVRSLTLEGAVDGIIYYIKPDFGRLVHFQVWFEAALQVFFSLGPAWGGVLTMASFSKFKNKCFSDAVLCTTMDLFTAFYCGFVVFAIVGFLANEAGMKMEEVSESGPGLVFLAYPEALARLPLPQLWSVLFFIMLYFVGLDSQFGMLETVTSGVADMYPNTLGQRKSLILVSAFTLYVSASLVFSTQAGIYIFQVIDWYVSAYSIFLTSLLECIVIGWLYGTERFSRDVEMMTGKSVHLFVRWSWMIFIPICMAIALAMALSNVSKPVYNDYIFPDYIGVIGPLIALVPVLPIPLFFILQIVNARGSLVQRLNYLIRPTADWGPGDKKERMVYKKFQYGTSFWQNVKMNLFGECYYP